MFDFGTLATYIVIVIGLFLVPGPAVLLVISRTLQGGRRIGIMTGLGIASGDLVHAMFSALGLSALLMTSSVAFNLVKIIGACYLIYLGVRSFISKSTGEEKIVLTPISPKMAYLQAVGAEVLNPKTAIFFLAFLPQFVHAEAGSSFLQFVLLGVILATLSIIYTSTLVICIQPLQRKLTALSRLRPWEGKIIGVIFCSLGIKVALQHH